MNNPLLCTISKLSHPKLSVKENGRRVVNTEGCLDNLVGGSASNEGPTASIIALTEPAEQQQLPRGKEFRSLIQQFLLDFNSAERPLALDHSLMDRRRQGPTNFPSSFMASKISFHMEISNTLEGVKPCVLFNALDVPGNPMTPFFDRLVEKEIFPPFKAYRLDKYGFTLSKVTHDLRVQETGENWRNSWVLADCRSDAWKTRRIQSVFFAPQNQDCSLSDIGDALDYPVLPVTMDMTNYERRYIYLDATAARELARRNGGQLQPVIGLEYLASDTTMQMQESREHFERYRTVGLKHGREYIFHSESIPSPDEFPENTLLGPIHGSVT
jgi:hypothetical protein